MAMASNDTYIYKVDVQGVEEAKRKLDNFYNYIEDGRDVDLLDFRNTLKSIQKIKDEYAKVFKQSPNSDLAKSLGAEIDKVAHKFRNTRFSFEGGEVGFGLDAALEKFAKNINPVMVDIENRFGKAHEKLRSLANQMSNMGSSDYFDVGTMQQYLSLLDQALAAQKEMDKWSNRELKVDDYPTAMSTRSLQSSQQSVWRDLEEMREYNLELRHLAQERRDIISDTEEYMYWDDDDLDRAKRHSSDYDRYQDDISELQRYISEKENLLQRLKDNEYTLFSSDDNFDGYVERVRGQLETYKKYLSDLESFRNGGGDTPTGTPIGDLKPLVKTLEEIRDKIGEISTAFKPLTDAMADGSSAFTKMLTSSADEVDGLIAKFTELLGLVDSINNKEFNMTNVISSGNNQGNDIEQIRAFRQEAKEVFKQVEDLYTESIETSKRIKGTPDGLSAFLDFSSTMADFDMSDLAKRIKSRSAASLGIVIDELNEWKRILLQFNNLRNNVDAGSFDVSRYNSTSSKVSITTKSSENDTSSAADTARIDDNTILDKIKDLSTRVQEELVSVRSKIEETFNLATLDPKLFDITNITQSIYSQFEELQKNIANLKFTIEATPTVVDNGAAATADAIDDEIEKAKEAKPAFSDAAKAKRDFADANKEAAKTADTTTPKLETEGEAAEDVGNKIEQAAGKIVEANDKFDKIKYTNTIDENGIPKPSSKVTIGTDKKENAYETTSTFSTYDDETGRYIEKTEIIIKDFKKRASELKKETAKIELAKKTVAKFLSQFNNKTAGHGSDIAGYTELENFEIKNLDHIEEAMQKMIDLDTKYNELTRNFRKGTKSMNPFVNAFNSMDEMRNKVRSTQLDFENLKSPTDTLKAQVEGLPELLQNLDDALTPDENGAINIEKIAKAYGNLNEAIKQANSSIGLQRKEERSKATTTTAEEKRVKSLYELYDKQAQSATKIHEYRNQLNSGNLGKEEARLVAAQLIQEKEQLALIQRQIKSYGDLYNAKELVATITHKLYMAELQRNAEEENQSVKAKEKELNELYKERSATITRIIQLNKKLGALKTDKAKDRAREEFESEKKKLALIDEEINQYGELANKQKLQKQDKRLKDNQVDTEISAEQKKDVDAVNKALQRRKEIHTEIAKLQKQMDAADGEQELSAIQKEIDALKVLEATYTRILNSYKDNALQSMVTAQDNEFREQDAKSKRQKRIQTAADADAVNLASQKQDYEDILSLVNQLFDAQTALHKINVDQSGKVHTAEREKEIERVKELSGLLKEVYGIDIKNLYGSLTKSDLLTQEQKNKLLEQEREYRRDIINLTAKASDNAATRQNKANQNYGKSIYNSANRKYEKIVGQMGTLEITNPQVLAQFDSYKQKIQELEQLRNRFANDPNAKNDPVLVAQFQKVAREADNAYKEIKEVLDVSEQLQNISASEQILPTTSLYEVAGTDNQSKIQNYINTIKDGKVQIKRWNADHTTAYITIDRGRGIIDEATVAIDKSTQSLGAYRTATENVGTAWERLKAGVGKKFKEVLNYALGGASMYAAFNKIRQGVTYVKEIDLALTELKKVTDETDATYKKFLKTASKTAAKVGSTVKDVVSSTADWARLGYSIAEATQLAESTQILMNVSEFTDVSAATDSLISSIQGFKYTAEESMGVVDILNTIGKRNCRCA
jgi:DNA repair exonuclease SbcCD ATPase subunit